MRFFADGPSLPDELLVARDEGSVLFFCGAGVSRAKAGLPGFLGLAEQVLQELHALPSSAARKLVDAAQELHEKPISGVGSLLAADRVFGLLERDFALTDIERAVGKALQPKSTADLSAHKTLLDLSRTADGDVQLVTTNFDRLFSAAAPRAAIWTPNQLPNLARNRMFRGIVHLHGLFDEEYCQPVGGRLVLSSAEFGRAYLAEGWATRFILDAIETFSIVFVGYSADDPPVQYLLEALSRVSDKSHGLYAFQEGREDIANALWSPKGVTALPYPSRDNHGALWQTLGAWAARARDPGKWRARVIRTGLRGPEPLRPYERGQLVHLALTDEGARTIADAKRTIPASWLGVFDPSIRFGTPGLRELFVHGSSEIDPFIHYGLDTDEEPPPKDPHDLHKRRDVPLDAIDVLSPTIADHVGAKCAGFRSSATELPQRLISLALWLGRVCDQPTAIWWAAGQRMLQPQLVRILEFQFSRHGRPLTPAVRTAWRYILDSGWNPTDEHGMRAYALKEKIAKEGWTTLTRREFDNVSRPYLLVKRPYGAGAPLGRISRARDVIQLDVGYTEQLPIIEIPEHELSNIVPILRRNLELADALETEVSPYFRDNIPSFEQSDDNGNKVFDQTGINPRVFAFLTTFKRLVDGNATQARQEMRAWSPNSIVFERLLLWAAGLPDFLSDQEAGAIFVQLSDRIFWGSRHQRDLLLALARRWSGLEERVRLAIERRMLKGRSRWRREGGSDFRHRRAYLTLERLHWLNNQQCALTLDLAKTTARLQKLATDWNIQDSGRAAESMSAEGGYVSTDASFEQLVDTPLRSLIEDALGARRHEFGALRQYDPFTGLCDKKPVRVLAALMLPLAAETSRVAWTHFLYSAGRQNDSAKLCALISRRLASLPSDRLLSIASPAASWFARHAENLFERDAEGARCLVDRLRATIEKNPASEHVASRLQPPNNKWVEAAWNSVAGDLTSALLQDTCLRGLPLAEGLPTNWVARCQTLLSLPGDHARFVIVRLAQSLSWLFAHDDDWAERNLLSALSRGGADRAAFVAGLFANARIEGHQLFARLKKLLFEVAKADSKEHQSRDSLLAGILASAWLLRDDHGHRWVSDEEMRQVLVEGSSELRGQVLWRMRSWQIDETAHFIENVWPLQLSARSATTTSRMVDLALANEADFPRIAQLILPHLTAIEHGTIFHSLSHGSEAKLVEQHPAWVLAVIRAILPLDASKWPYGAEETLSRLKSIAPALAREAAFRELVARLKRRRH